MQIYKCNNCSKIHLEVGNILIHFKTPENISEYLGYLESIDSGYHSAYNRTKGLSKDIYIPINGVPVHLALTIEEFDLLKKTIRDYLSGKAGMMDFVKMDLKFPVN